MNSIIWIFRLEAMDSFMADNHSKEVRSMNMSHIRRKLEQNPAEPQYVFTEIGIGYRMIEDEMQ